MPLSRKVLKDVGTIELSIVQFYLFRCLWCTYKIYILIIGCHHIPITGLHCSHQYLYAIVCDKIIAVNKIDIISFCRIHTSIACCRQSPVLFMPYDSRLLFPLGIIIQHSFKDFYALVGCAVVHKDDIEIVIRLLKDGAGAPLDIFLHAVYRHENTDCVWFLRHSSNT